jgi:hypothetical protein
MGAKDEKEIHDVGAEKSFRAIINRAHVYTGMLVICEILSGYSITLSMEVFCIFIVLNSNSKVRLGKRIPRPDMCNQPLYRISFRIKNRHLTFAHFQ